MCCDEVWRDPKRSVRCRIRAARASRDEPVVSVAGCRRRSRVLPSRQSRMRRGLRWRRECRPGGRWPVDSQQLDDGVGRRAPVQIGVFQGARVGGSRAGQFAGPGTPRLPHTTRARQNRRRLGIGRGIHLLVVSMIFRLYSPQLRRTGPSCCPIAMTKPACALPVSDTSRVVAWRSLRYPRITNAKLFLTSIDFSCTSPNINKRHFL